ncbi:MAG: Do family serine endopeptidase [Candidatus Binataceae bacterium]|nr:Do family serine endopeptidase [Candidatus Binataceae bacterium]
MPFRQSRPAILLILALSFAIVVAAEAVLEAADRLWTELPASARPTGVQAPDFADLAARLSPSVVNIAVEQKPVRAGGGSVPGLEVNPSDRFGSAPEETHPRGVGSGFLINKAGYILTNDHVVANASKINVTTNDGHRYRGQLIGRDPKTDVALIKISPRHPMAVAPLGDSQRVRVGSWVMAIGNPFGFDHTVTVGVVSAKGRFIPGNYDEFLQTDAPINPGNSGGPLIDTRGEVVGVNSAIYTRTGSNTGISFAIPIDMVKRELPALETGHEVVRGWLGVYIETVTPEIAAKYRLDIPHGALVDEVIEGSPAMEAGLKKGDLVVAYDGRPIGDSQELPLMVGATSLGNDATLTVIRNQAQREVRVRIRGSHEPQLASNGSLATDLAAPPLGLSVQNFDLKLARQLGLDKPGVRIDAVTPGSAGAQAGLHANDVVVEVNRQPVTNLADYQRALKEGGMGKPVLLLVRRGKIAVFVPVGPRG